MDDLTQRLRRGLQWSDDGWPVSGTSDDMQAAAARIEALEAEVARLERALRRTADQALKEEVPGGYVPEASADWHAGYDAAIRHARVALTPPHVQHTAGVVGQG